MVARGASYERREADFYPTRDQWVVDALIEHFPVEGVTVWEPACGAGDMVRSLQVRGAKVLATDLFDQGCASRLGEVDFCDANACRAFLADSPATGCITNPPYGVRSRLAEAFVNVLADLISAGALEWGALLLPVDFDSARSRAPTFADPQSPFAGKVVLHRRITWFEREGAKASPASNHAWFVFSRSAIGNKPVILYGPTPGADLPEHEPPEPLLGDGKPQFPEIPACLRRTAA